MLILRGGSKGLRNIQASEMLGGKCTNSGKTSNTGQYPQGKNQLHSLGHNLHFYEQESFALLSAFYNLQSCKIAQRQGKSEIVQRRPDRTPPSHLSGSCQSVSQVFSILLILFASHSFAKRSQHSRSLVNIYEMKGSVVKQEGKGQGTIFKKKKRKKEMT